MFVFKGVVPTPAAVSAIGSMAENNRPESARSNRSGNRVIYQPAENLGSTRSSSVQNVMHLNDIETPGMSRNGFRTTLFDEIISFLTNDFLNFFF